MGSEYKTVTRDGKRRPAHVVLMEELLGRPLEKDEVVHHINGDKSDNRPENLAVLGRAEHTRLHATGVTPGPETLKKLRESHRGRPSANRSLTREQVQAVAEQLRSGVSLRRIAEQFPVSATGIAAIRDGKAYRDFLEEYSDEDFPLREKRKAGKRNETERKLSVKEVGLLRVDLLSGESVPVIAKRYGLSLSSVRAIRDGVTYREIPWPQEVNRLFATRDMPTLARILLENPLSEKESDQALKEDYHLMPNLNAVLMLRMVKRALDGDRELALMLLLMAGYGDAMEKLIHEQSVLWTTLFPKPMDE